MTSNPIRWYVSQFSAEEALRQQMVALQTNDHPYPDHGVEVMYRVRLPAPISIIENMYLCSIKYIYKCKFVLICECKCMDAYTCEYVHVICVYHQCVVCARSCLTPQKITQCCPSFYKYNHVHIHLHIIAIYCDWC